MRQLAASLSALTLLIGLVGLIGLPAAAQPPANPDVELKCGNEETQAVCAKKKGGTYTYDIISKPSTLNPVTTQDTASDSIHDHIFGTFFTDYSLLGDGVDDPQAAEMLQINEAGNMLTARLREGLKFSDGSSVTTSDVQYWYYNVIWNPNLSNSLTDVFTCPSGQAYQFKPISDREFRFGCPDSEPFRTFPDDATGLYVLSQQMALDLIESQGISTNPAIAPGPNGVLDSSTSGDDKNRKGAVIVPGKNGTLDSSASGDDVMIEHAAKEFLGIGVDISLLRGLGPYVMTDFASSSSASYERNPNFYEVDSNGKQLPYLDGMQVLIVDNQNVSLSNFIDGTTDVLAPRPQDLSVLRSEQASGGFPLNDDIDNATAAGGETFVSPNFGDTNKNLAAAARNTKVRRALSLAIDRVALVNNVLLGIGTPQYTPVTLGEQDFFLGRNNTCQTLIDAGLATSDNCSDGTWTVRNGLEVNVSQLPAPTTPEIRQHLSCLTDYQSCLEQARSLLDEAGVTDTNGDGVREIPANFSDAIDNPGGPFETQINTNAGNTVREQYTRIVADGWSRIGIDAQAGTVSFPTLVDQLLSGKWSGHILIGLTGGDPAGGVNVWPCGTALHLWHVNCNPEKSEGPAAPTKADSAIDSAWTQGFNAANLEGAQKAFDKFQTAFMKYEPLMHLAVQNALFAVRTDRLCNAQRSIDGGGDIKFRVDISGQTECPR
ncbi:MAG: ABC transporter substrate-binding protein [Candidatus Bipolaricaulia bacterium]